MSWIRLAIAGAAFFGVASVASAQGQHGARGGPPQQGGQWGRGGASMLFAGIDLNAAQKDQVQKLMDKYKAEREALRPAGGQMQGPPDEATRAKMADIRTRSTAEYRAILTADQQKIFDKNVADMRARMEQRQKEH